MSFYSDDDDDDQDVFYTPRTSWVDMGDTASMSSNSLDGHSLLTDLSSDPSPELNLNVNKSTTTTRRGGSQDSVYGNPKAYEQYKRQLYQRNQAQQKPNVMMSMTAVLEAAQDNEYFSKVRYEQRAKAEEALSQGQNITKTMAVNGKGGGSSLARARQTLSQHTNESRRISMKSGSHALSTLIEGEGNTQNPLPKSQSSEQDPPIQTRSRANKVLSDPSVPSKGYINSKFRAPKDIHYVPQRTQSVHYWRHKPSASSPLASSTKTSAPKPAPAPVVVSNGLLNPTPPRNIGHRRSRSLGHNSSTSISAHANNANNPRRADSPIPGFGPRHPNLVRSHSHSRTQSLTASTNNKGKGKSRADATSAAAEVDALMPRSDPKEHTIPSNGTQGYSSLVLPRAPPPLNLSRNKGILNLSDLAGDTSSSIPNTIGTGTSKMKNFVVGVGGVDGKIDLTKNGMAQTTMASVEVVRGLGSMVGKKPWSNLMGGLVRRKTIDARSRSSSLPLHMSRNLNNASLSNGHESGMGVGKEGSALGFTSYRKPPEYVPSGSVLVQVWAVGVDSVDGRLVGVPIRVGCPVSSTFAPPPPPPVLQSILINTGNSGAIPEEQETVREDEVQEKVVEKKTKGLGGLGRSLSLRERLSRSVSLGRKSAKAFLQKEKERLEEEERRQTEIRQEKEREKEKEEKEKERGQPTPIASVGYVPGRSFVGRVVECGWEVRDEIIRKGEWVVGLLDIKKGGALTEFIIVDRHRIHRVPHPKLPISSSQPLTSVISNEDSEGLTPMFTKQITSSPSPTSTTFSHRIHPHSPRSQSRSHQYQSRGQSQNQGPQHQESLTLEELALLPLCGVPAYRAVRTFVYAFSSTRDTISASLSSSISSPSNPNSSSNLLRTPSHRSTRGIPGRRGRSIVGGEHDGSRRRRILVLRGHDGVGAMAVQMLVMRGWRVCVHVPFLACPSPPSPSPSSSSPPTSPSKTNASDNNKTNGNALTQAIADNFMEELEHRIRSWGAEEVIFDDGEIILPSRSHHPNSSSSPPSSASASSASKYNENGDEGRGAVIRVIDGLREDGDVFDAILDCVGGKEIRFACEKLLRSTGLRTSTGVGVGVNMIDGGGNGKTNIANGGTGNGNGNGTKGMGQFTTIIGDNPERPIPSAGDLFRAGLRSLKFGGGGGGGGGNGPTRSNTLTSSPIQLIMSPTNSTSGNENHNHPNGNGKGGKVGYAWVNISQDVDWEGKDVGETIGSVIELALEFGIRPWVGTQFAIMNDDDDDEQGQGRGANDSGSKLLPPPRIIKNRHQKLKPSIKGKEKATDGGDDGDEGELTRDKIKELQLQEFGGWEGKRVVKFEKTPEVFVIGGPLSIGGTVVVNVAT